MRYQRLILMFLLVLLGSTPVFSQVHPIVLQHHVASTGTALPIGGVEVADISTFTVSNPFSAKPVWIIGTPSVLLDPTATIGITGTPSVIVTSVPPVTVVPLSGILGTASLSISATVPTALPTAPVGSTKCFIMPTQDVNFGDTTVTSGTAPQYFFQSVPGQGFFGHSVVGFTTFRLIGRTTVATATIIWQ